MIFVDFLSPVFTSLMNLRLFLAPPGENVSVWIPKTDTHKKRPQWQHMLPLRAQEVEAANPWSLLAGHPHCFGELQVLQETLFQKIRWRWPEEDTQHQPLTSLDIHAHYIHTIYTHT